MIKHTDKPWGYEKLLSANDKYAVKLLFVKKGHRLSLQYHNTKRETMYILEGFIRLTMRSTVFLASAKSHPIEISPKDKHRIEAIEDSLIFEVSTTELDDVVRIEDDYGRV